MEKQYDVAVIIGRFQPFHNGHQVLVDTARAMANSVLVLVGSSHKSRDIKNPFTFKERETMIFKATGLTHIRGLPDDLYNENQWIAYVQDAVNSFVTGGTVCIVGRNKDESSYYLKSFPEWDLVEARNHQITDGVHATDIRTQLFTGVDSHHLIDISYNVANEINIWKRDHAEAYKALCEEYHFITKYKESFAAMPYPPTFVTTDAVVINNGYILLVKRRAAPGKGLFALPGGFLNQNEQIKDGIIRELVEETKIKVSENVLRASLRGIKVFDAPGRSLRGRTITHAGLIVLNERRLPKVRGSDDAEKAKWFPISDFFSHKMEEKMFEDHHSIITSMLAMVTSVI